MALRNNHLTRNYPKNGPNKIITKLQKRINTYICMLVVYGGGNNLEANLL